jgi:hypothetical protein
MTSLEYREIPFVFSENRHTNWNSTFVLKSGASVKVSIHEIRGKIVRYIREVDGAYEVTIRSKE